MNKKPFLIASDLEGVYTPEVWINVAEKTGIPELRLTTRDIKDYNELMQGRLRILAENGLKLRDIQEVIASMDPLPGAIDFINWVRETGQIIILSDTFYEFAEPLMIKMGRPTLFCHSLEVDAQGFIRGYHLRIPDSKRLAVTGFKNAGFRVIAIGDSYNDTTMLSEADHGILFHAPENVINDFPAFPAANEYTELQNIIQGLRKQ